MSERMLARAKAETRDAAISYIRADLEGLLGRVHAALAPGGHLLFSVEHPIVTAPTDPGWSVDAARRAAWPVRGYPDEGPRRTDWLVACRCSTYR